MKGDLLRLTDVQLKRLLSNFGMPVMKSKEDRAEALAGKVALKKVHAICQAVRGQQIREPSKASVETAGVLSRTTNTFVDAVALKCLCVQG